MIVYVSISIEKNIPLLPIPTSLYLGAIQALMVTKWSVALAMYAKKYKMYVDGSYDEIWYVIAKAQIVRVDIGWGYFYYIFGWGGLGLVEKKFLIVIRHPAQLLNSCSIDFPRHLIQQFDLILKQDFYAKLQYFSCHVIHALYQWFDPFYLIN